MILNNNEKGSAIIYTLAIMTLMTLLATAFLFSSNTNLKEANSISHNVNTNYILESGINKVQGTLKYMFMDGNNEYKATSSSMYPSSPFISNNQYGFFAEEHPSWGNKQKLLYSSNDIKITIDEKESIIEGFGGIKYFVPRVNGRRCNNPCSNKNQCYWHKLFTNLSWEDCTVDDKLVGRYLYIVIDNSGGVNPYSISSVDSQKNKDISALHLKDFYNQRGQISAEDAKALKDNEDEDIPWLTQENMLRTTQISEPYSHILFPYVQKEADAYWVDKAESDGIPNGRLDVDSELYSRFNMNLSDAQWNAMEVDSIIAAPALYTETTGSAPVADNAGGIGWLHNWGNIHYWSEQGVDTSLIDIQRKQIAANLIDFFDTDSIPTMDITEEDINDGKIPLYMGIEKTPFINEIAIQATPIISSTLLKFSASIDIKVGAELINMFAEDFSNEYELEIEGDIAFDIIQRTNPNKTLISKEDNINKFKMTITFKDIKKQSYQFLWGTGSSSNIILTNVDVTHNKTVNIRNLSANIATVRLYNKESLYQNKTLIDYASLGNRTASNGPTLVEIRPKKSSNDSDEHDYYFSYQIDDPRKNLKAEDWIQGLSTHTKYGYNKSNPQEKNSRYGSVNDINYRVNCRSWSRSRDYESESTPTKYNSIIEAGKYGFNQGTKYIDELGMTLLGAVHRGEPWATLNLKKYEDFFVDSPKNQELSRGGGLFEDSDISILDQITMRADNNSEVYKLNVNTPNMATLQGGYAESGDKTLSQNTMTATGVRSSNKPRTPSAFIRRSEMGKNAYFRQADYESDTYSGDTKYDFKSEIGIAKYFNYFSTRYNYFTVLVQAQSVNDRGNVEIGGETGTEGVFDEGIDYITAEKKQIIVYQRDAWTNEWKVLSRENID